MKAPAVLAAGITLVIMVIVYWPEPTVIREGIPMSREDARCYDVMMDFDSHWGACFRDYWDEYKSCSAGIGGTFTGCVILQGEEHLAPPWCFPENCAALHAKDPERFSLWP